MKLILFTQEQLDYVKNELPMSYDDKTDAVHALFEKKGQCCADCGLDLALDDWQFAWMLKFGNTVPRPLCPNNPEGLHRVDREPEKGREHAGTAISNLSEREER